MADSLCGPSNALHSFQKHAQVDRTLQQDRFAQRQPQKENFRSTTPSYSPELEAEFQAFKSGQPIAGVPLHPLAHQQPALAYHAPAPQQPGMPAWATDFQQLNLGGGAARQSPIPAGRFRHEAPLQLQQQRSSPSGGWHSEFLRQDRTATPPLHAPSFGQLQQYGMPATRFGPMQPMMASSPAQQTAQQAPSALQDADMFDDSAFAAAFDNAAAAFSQAAGQTDKSKGKEKAAAPRQEGGVEDFDLSKACVDPPEAFTVDPDEEDLYGGDFQHDQWVDDGFEPQMSGANGALQEHWTGPEEHDVLREAAEDAKQLHDLGGPLGDREALGLQREGTGAQEPKVEEERLSPEVEADELSRTAGQLLDNLKDEHGEKFAKSSFMALMRQLRDKEVRVEGENFVEISHALHPGGPAYPHGAFQQSSAAGLGPGERPSDGVSA